MHPRVQWAVAKAQAAVLLDRAWNEEDHPRVPGGSGEHGGEFAPAGGGSGGTGSVKIDGLPPMDTSGQSWTLARQATERGIFDMRVSGVRGSGSRKTYDVTVTPKDIPGDWKSIERGSGTKTFYNPQYAHAEGEGVAQGLAYEPETFTKPEKTPGLIYRGMSYEEYQRALKDGYFASIGDYNVVESQAGLTYYSPDPLVAAHYANGFAPWPFKATPTRPAVVIAIRDPGNHVIMPAIPNEIGLKERVPISALDHVYLGHPVSITEGTFDVRTSDAGGHVGSSYAYDPAVRWEKEQSPSSERFVSPSPSEFIAARDKSTRQGFLSPLKPDDLSEHTLLTNKDKTVGAAIDPQGDLQNVFNNGGPKGAAADVIVAAIDKGAVTLDCYDGHLPRYYRQFGFEETQRIKFNPAFAHGWDVKQNGQPDVVFMAWKGYVGGDAKGAIERAKSKENWLSNERSNDYATDYDAAKAQSRAVARRTKDHRSGGGRFRAPVDRAGDQSLARTGAGDRQPLVRSGLAERLNPQRRIAWASARAQAAVLLARAWNESEHPRDPAGTSTGGQFTSGGSGEAANAPSGGKKKVEIADFAKDDLMVSTETRNNPERAQKFLEAWNGSIGETPEEFKKHFLGGNGTMAINYYPSEDAIEVSGSLHDERGDVIGSYTRNIDFDDRKAVSSYFNINKAYQNRDLGKQVLASNITMYQKMGIEEVSVHANIDVGGYAWAKYGYVPTRHSWYEDLQDKLTGAIDRMSSGGDSGDGSSWEELSSGTQERIEREFYLQTHDEFVDSEVNSWRESGQALQEAKTDLVEQFNASVQDWGEHAIDGYRKAREEDGKSPIPFDNFTLLDATSIEFKSKYDDGRGDFDVSFDDEKLTEPKGAPDPAQQTLPGIEAVKPHERLTEEMRSGIEDALAKGFDREAEQKADDIDPPGYIGESAREYQQEYWSGLDDNEKFQWAEQHEPDLVTGGEVRGTGEMPDEDAERLRKLAMSDDPKAIWAIADSKYGKDLLLGTSWSGVLKLTDKESIDRFNAYVAKKASKAA